MSASEAPGQAGSGFPLRIFCTACNLKVKLAVPPPERAGRCPKCGKTLFEWRPGTAPAQAVAAVVAPASPSDRAPAPVPSVPGVEPDPLQAWMSYPAHLLLLEHFSQPRQLDAPKDGRGWVHYFDPSRWPKLVGEPVEHAVNRFFEAGLLRRLTNEEALDCRFNVNGLKALAREHGIPVSGRKDELIARLLHHDRERMETLANPGGFLRCSATGDALVKRAQEARLAERQAACARAWACLAARDIPGAGRAVGEYESRQLEPRGINIDWREYPRKRDLETLRLIFDRTPKLLGNLPASEIAELRPLAAMMLLWGTNDITEWARPDLKVTSHLDRDAAARMLLFHAWSLQRLDEHRECGVKHLTFYSVGDASTCEACAELDGKVYPLDRAPELPLQVCTCADGCRCDLQMTDPEEMLE